MGGYPFAIQNKAQGVQTFHVNIFDFRTGGGGGWNNNQSIPRVTMRTPADKVPPRVPLKPKYFYGYRGTQWISAKVSEWMPW